MEIKGSSVTAPLNKIVTGSLWLGFNTMEERLSCTYISVNSWNITIIENTIWFNDFHKIAILETTLLLCQELKIVT